MENSIYLSLSRQMTLKNDLTIVANNIANMNTPGYRGQNLTFQELVERPNPNGDPLSFVTDSIQYKTTSAGPLSHTGSPLHAALTGPGFFGLQTPQGQTVYSRAGDFTLSPNGTLTSPAGYPALSTEGAPISIPKGASHIHIDAQGRLSSDQGEIGQLMIVEFANPQNLTPKGNNSYHTNDNTLPAKHTQLKQGYLEGANIKPVLEMTRMIEISRNYQRIQNTLESEHERLRGAIQKLTGRG